MQRDAVKVPVAASVRFECEFWPEDDGWTCRCSQLAVAARGNNFEEAKKNMEEVLRHGSNPFSGRVRATLPLKQ
jgi:hypothetical protein